MNEPKFQDLNSEGARELPAEPRRIDPKQTFEALVEWMVQATAEAPGLVVPISGTDSYLALRIAAEAARRQGRLKDELIAVHYGEQYPWTMDILDAVGDIATLQVVDLKATMNLQPGSPGWIHPERHRWAAIQTLALQQDFWVVGTRNRTEDELGTFSLASQVAVLQPIRHLWKSEVLQICGALDAPVGMLHSSRCGDQQCGRPSAHAENIELVDQLLMIERSELDPKAVSKSDPELVNRLLSYVSEAKERHAFKHLVPYLPPPEAVKI